MYNFMDVYVYGCIRLWMFMSSEPLPPHICRHVIISRRISPATSIAAPATLGPAKLHFLGLSSARGLAKYVFLLL